MEKNSQGDGAVRQAFQGALRQELADLYRLLASLEAMAENPLPSPGDAENDNNSGGYLTLRRLLVWLGEPLVNCFAEYMLHYFMLPVIPPGHCRTFRGTWRDLISSKCHPSKFIMSA